MYFQQQLTLEEWEQAHPGRVAGQERSVISVLSEHGRKSLQLIPGFPALTVGDWVLFDESSRLIRCLERTSLFARKAAGSRVGRQLIAANVDTLFVVTSMNQDFNLNRMERYLVLAHESGASPVAVLTKQDLCDDPQAFERAAQSLDPDLPVVAVNSLEKDSVSALAPWCLEGTTVALLGSSGVGKSTLLNTLLGEEVQQTRSIREDDAKGRHTTTGRSLHLLPSGGILLDTPGMRELQLADCESGIGDTFTDILALAESCRFSDCGHSSEPGCAVQDAIRSGELEQRRLDNFHKLNREQAFNKATLAEKRRRDRELGKFYKSVLASKQKSRG